MDKTIRIGMPKKGDRIKLKSSNDLVKIFDATNWFFRSNRVDFANILSRSVGIVTSVDSKYEYFYFTPDGTDKSYSLNQDSIAEIMSDTPHNPTRNSVEP